MRDEELWTNEDQERAHLAAAWHHHGHGDGEREGRRERSDEEGRRGRGGRRGHVRGGGFPGRPPLPPMPPGFHGFGPMPGEPRMRGTRARRGDVRAAALALLAEQPMNGYQIIQEIGERSGGVWRPSPGSVYPALQQLEDEGLIRAESGDGGRRGYVLTDEGRSYADEHPDELRAPWDEVAGGTGDTVIEMRSLLGQLGMAAFQVISAGTEAQQAQARKVLTDTRKSLYRILAADEDDAAADAGETQ
ncbi:MAG TPA: PadR family transcriptional regulator [Streptosporangiaceae bacterium]|jgi:DNA-binding PadR family transcriptional regulator